MARKRSRSPLKAGLLRLPGQSADEEINRLIGEHIDSYVIIAALLLVLAVFEWMHVATGLPPIPWIVTAVAVPVAAYGAFRVISLIRRVRDLELGRDGERAFGQFLDDKLRPLGYEVLHDVRGGNWNVDHVIVGEKGVYTIETKTRSKPIQGSPVVKVDGDSVTVGGWKPDRDPIAQAKRQAVWLSETLSRSLAMKLPIQAIVVFPGWFVESAGKSSEDEVWVLSGRELPAFIANSRYSVAPETVRTVSRFLRQMVRAAGA